MIKQKQKKKKKREEAYKEKHKNYLILDWFPENPSHFITCMIYKLVELELGLWNPYLNWVGIWKSMVGVRIQFKKRGVWSKTSKKKKREEIDWEKKIEEKGADHPSQRWGCPPWSSPQPSPIYQWVRHSLCLRHTIQRRKRRYTVNSLHLQNASATLVWYTVPHFHLQKREISVLPSPGAKT